jgi:DNA-binding IclR family transcriptional regulator
MMNTEILLLDYLCQHKSTEIKELLEVSNLPPRQTMALLSDMSAAGLVRRDSRAGTYSITEYGLSHLVKLQEAENKTAQEAADKRRRYIVEVCKDIALVILGWLLSRFF